MPRSSMREALTDPEVEPGEVLETLRHLAVMGDGRPDTRPIETLEEQRELAEAKLGRFLANIADSDGARTVVERFYREEHGEDIDAADPDVLREWVPDVESILQDRRLPVVSKEILREEYGVEGAPGGDGEGEATRPHLMPAWVAEHDEEPVTTTTTTGTTGEPWGRPMTRNDAAVFGMNVMDFAWAILDDYGAEPENVALANPWPEAAIREPIGRALQAVGFRMQTFDYERIKAGGEEERAAVEAINDHLSSENTGAIVYPVELLLEGALGVHLRRGNLDLDVIINTAAPVKEEAMLADHGIEVYDIYGETEHPEPGLEKTIDGETGYDIPLNTQLNLVYHEEADELAFEGTGRFAHLPFAVEGQAVPGVYLSGIRGTLTRTDDGHQLLSDIERVHDTGGCTDAE